MFTSKEILVEWEGPYSYDEVISKYNLNNEVRTDFGLYQIYGPHPLYSNKNRQDNDKVLLYIGRTTKSNFSNRISIHGFCHDLEHEIYLGRIDPESKIDNDIWESDVKDAEIILINKYTPSYNGMFVGDLRKDQLNCPDCVIVNQGKKMDLDERFESEKVVYHQK